MSGYRLVSRQEWGADPLQVACGYTVPDAQIVGLVVHHTVIVMPDYDHDGMVAGDVDDVCAYMRALQRARPDLCDDVPYSFVHFEGATDDEVIVAEGRGFGRTGAHTVGYNSTRYGCALAGDYTSKPPTAGQLAGIRWIGSTLVDPIGAQPTLGHRDTASTACPGAMAYPLLDRVQPPFTTEEPEEDDMAGPMAEADSAAEFVTKLYKNIAGRAPDPHGYDYWLSQLLSGRPPQQVEHDFAGAIFAGG